MHHAVIIVCCVEMCDLSISVFVKIMLCSFFKILPMNCYILVSIKCALHVIESKSWKKIRIKIDEIRSKWNKKFSYLILSNLPCKNSCIIVAKRKHPAPGVFFFKFKTCGPVWYPTLEKQPPSPALKSRTFMNMIAELIWALPQQTYTQFHIINFISSSHEFYARNWFKCFQSQFNVILLLLSVIWIE